MEVMMKNKDNNSNSNNSNNSNSKVRKMLKGIVDSEYSNYLNGEYQKTIDDVNNHKGDIEDFDIDMLKIEKKRLQRLIEDIDKIDIPKSN